MKFNFKKEKKEEKKSFLKFLFNSRFVIVSFAVGLLLGLGIMQAFIPTQMATLSDDSDSIALWGKKDKNGNYPEGLSANELFENLKGKTDISVVLDLIDARLLEEKYPYKEYKEKAVASAEEYISFYTTSYGLTEADFLNYYGFTSKDAFVEYLTLDTQRYDFFAETIKKDIKEKEIKSFYKSDVFGDIVINYVAVPVNDESKVDEALIKEIAKKIKNGSTYEQIRDTYTDKEGFNANELTITFDGGYDPKLVKEARKLKNGKHSSSYIKSDEFGYVIVFRKSSETKPEYEEVKDLIPDIILNNMTKKDEKLFLRTFIEYREEQGVTFTDTNFAKAYKKFVKANK